MRLFKKVKCHGKRCRKCEITQVRHTCFLEVATGWRISFSICSENSNTLLKILLYYHGCRWAAKNCLLSIILGCVCVKSATWLKTRWCIFLMSGLYSYNILSRMIFHWWMQCFNTGRCSQRNRLFPPCSFPDLPWCAALPWCDWCLLKRSIFGPSKSGIGWLESKEGCFRSFWVSGSGLMRK